MITAHLTRFSIRNPFYGHFLTGLSVQSTDRIPDIGLGTDDSGRLTLFANPGFWAKLPEGSPVAERLIKHEVLHLLLGHYGRAAEFPNTRLYFLAADLVVNQYTGIEPGAEGEITLAHFRDLYLEPKREIGYYYQRLNRAWETLLNRAKLLGEPAVSAHPYLKYFLLGCPAVDRHVHWPGPEKNQVIRLSILAGLGHWKKTGQAPALAELPAQVRAQLDAASEVFASGINWKNVLRKFAAGSRSTYLKNTLHRPSKRYGRPPGFKIRQKSRLVVGVDVSGSVSPALLQVFFREIHRFWRLGAEVEVVEFDSRIQKKYPYKGAIPHSVTGRGDTDFNPPIAAANQEKTADGLIMLTDGLGQKPAVFPVMPALWVIAGRKTQGSATSKFPGRVINIT